MIPAASDRTTGMTLLNALAGPALVGPTTAFTGNFQPAFMLLSALSRGLAILLLSPMQRPADSNDLVSRPTGHPIMGVR
jgi:hypothetical protein